MSSRIRRVSGRRAAEAGGTLLALVLLTTACNSTLRAGAGLPSHVRTLAVVPFENETDRFDIPQEIYEAVLRDVPRAFGIQAASEEHADAVIRGRIRRYSVDAPSFRTGAQGGVEVMERSVSIGMEVQVVDRVNNVILWEDRSLQARGEYLEDTELEEQGRELAVERIVRAIVDGIQSNW
jgi:hypothetical protein